MFAVSRWISGLASTTSGLPRLIHLVSVTSVTLLSLLGALLSPRLAWVGEGLLHIAVLLGDRREEQEAQSESLIAASSAVCEKTT